jgi:hypothetical protein
MMEVPIITKPIQEHYHGIQEQRIVIRAMKYNYIVQEKIPVQEQST